MILLSFCISYNANTQSIPLKIGDHFGGGIIFYLDESNEHGLISAPENQTDRKVMWGRNGITGAASTTNGQENTKRILKYFTEKKKSPEKSAAFICDTMTLGGFHDWYLPSIFELNKMYEKQDLIGNFQAGDYCSSTEYGPADACNMHFRPHRTLQFYYNKDNKEYYVRCIRKF